jgi:hypothetical protein
MTNMIMASKQVSPDIMNTDFQPYGIFGEYVAIDDMTVKCYGCNSLTEFIHEKPETFVCKV